MPAEGGPKRVAIIGAGFICDYHVQGLRAAGAEVAAIVGRDARRTQARAASLQVARAQTDAQAVFEDPAIDAVVIATPDASHEELTRRALRAGKPTLLQKPMATTSAACLALIAEAHATRTSLSVSFMHRHFPEVRWLAALLASGDLGRVHTVRMRNATPGADWANWFFDPQAVSGGVVMQLGVHGVDLLQTLFGPIVGVRAECATLRPSRRLADGSVCVNPFEDNALALYELACGARVSHEMSYTEIAGCDRFRLELYAERGVVWLRSERGAAAICAPTLTGVNGWITPDLPDEPFGRAHHRAWLDALATGVDDATALSGLSTLRVAEAIYAAARAPGASVAP